MPNTKELTQAEFDKIEQIMDGRDFAIMHWGENGRAFCNTRDRTGLPHLVECAASHMRRGGEVRAIGFADAKPDLRAVDKEDG